MSYELRAATRQRQRMVAIYSDLHQQLLDGFHQAGIEICSPHYRAHRQHDVAMATSPA